MKRYPKYKDSGVEWIGEIPEHWVSIKIGHFSTILRGSGYQNVTKIDDSEDSIKMIRISDFHEFAPIDVENTEIMQNYLVSESDILFAGTGATAGIIMFVERSMDGYVHSYNVLKIRADNINSKFLYYSFNSHNIKEQENLLFSGSAQHFLDIESIANLKISTPPESEQSVIIKYLDQKTHQIDTLIEKKQKQIYLLKEQRTAIINQAVTKGLNPDVKMKDSGIEWLGEVPEHWEIKPFKYCCQIAEGQVDPKADDFKDCILIAPNHIESGTGRLLLRETADEQGAISGKYRVKKGDVVYCKIRPELNKVCLAVEDSLCSADMYPIKTERDMLSRFMLYFMLSDTFVRIMVNESMRVAMPKINRDTIRNYELPVPPLDEQSEIVKELDNKVDGIFMFNERLGLTIDQLKEYRTALISEAVTGKIDVRDEVIQ